MKKTVRFVSNLVFLILLVTLLYAYAMFQGGFVSWFLFFSFSPIFIYQFVFLLYPINRWHVERSISKQAISAGDRISITVTVTRKVPFPLYYCVLEDMTPETLERIDYGESKFEYLANPEQLERKRHLKVVKFPLFRRRFTFTYELDDMPRGEHSLEWIRLKTGDLFGFIKKEHQFYVSTNVIVFPAKRSIRYQEDFQSLEQGATASVFMQNKHTNIATTSREYVPGDRLSWIDWKQTARTNKMMTKEFEQEKGMDALLVLDSTTNNRLALDGAIEVAAALYQAVHKQMSTVDFLTCGAEIKSLSSQIGRKETNTLQYQLATLDGSSQQARSSQLKIALQQYRNSHTIIFVTTELNEQIRKAIQDIYHGKQQWTIFLVQSIGTMSINEKKYVDQLKKQGMMIHLLAEKELMQEPIEVTMS